jgi:hypothetical protein
MTDQEASIKMTEMCGYKKHRNSMLGEHFDHLDKGIVTNWNPAENIKQAFEVLDAMNLDYVITRSCPSGVIWYDVEIYINIDCRILGRKRVSHELETCLSQAIFQAVKKFLEVPNE